MIQEQCFYYILFFYLYSFLGWIFETCYVSAKKKEWINRGFLKGPMLPIYGTGAVMMLLVSKPFTGNLVLTYLAGVVGATLLELVTGWAIEKIFKVRYWDYSYQRFHFKGYICLSSSIAWGFFTLIMTLWIHPFVLERVTWIPVDILQMIVGLVGVIFMIDLTISIIAALEIRDMIIHIEKMRKEAQLMKKRADVVLACIDDDIKSFKHEHPEIERIEHFIEEMEEKLQYIHSNQNMYNQLNHKMRRELLICQKNLNNVKKNSLRARKHIKGSIQKRIQANPTMHSANYRKSFEAMKESFRNMRP